MSAGPWLMKRAPTKSSLGAAQPRNAADASCRAATPSDNYIRRLPHIEALLPGTLRIRPCSPPCHAAQQRPPIIISPRVARRSLTPTSSQPMRAQGARREQEAQGRGPPHHPLRQARPLAPRGRGVGAHVARARGRGAARVAARRLRVRRRPAPCQDRRGERGRRRGERAAE